MEFALTEDQCLLQDAARGILAAASDLDAVRRFAAGDAAVEDAVTAALAEFGAPLLMIPEAHGGLGLGALEAALVQEAIGAVVAPARFTGASAIAVAAVRQTATEDEQARWLPLIAAGDVRIAVALQAAVSNRGGAKLVYDGQAVSGQCLFAFDAREVTHILTATAENQICLVDARAPGVSISPLQTIDRTRSLFEIKFDQAKANRLGETATPEALAATLALGRVLFAADTLGAAQAMVDAAVAYAKERKQFGRVIGSFQAVKHMCADMAARLEPCRALVWHAAYTLDTDPARAVMMACHAKAHISEVATFVARTATEVHGGMGFTDLLGQHYWFKRIGVNRQLLGAPEQLRDEAARAQGLLVTA